jgi:hypothetical protein
LETAAWGRGREVDTGEESADLADLQRELVLVLELES